MGHPLEISSEKSRSRGASRLSLAVPISVRVTAGALYFLGFTLNVLSLMGLMLAVGMLVDNAVVVTENIHRHQRMTPDDRRGATLRAVKEVGRAVTAGTLTTAIVFLPMIVSQSDQVTLFLKHVSVAICVALGVSLAISLTVVPLLTVRVAPPNDTDEPGWLTWLVDRYGRLLDAFLRRKGVAALSILGLLLSVAIPGALVSQDFFPNDNTSRELRLHFHVNDTYTVERVEDAVDRVEDFLFAHQDTLEIESVYSYYRAGYAQSTILLTDDGEPPLDDLEEQILDGLPTLTVADPSFTRDGGGDEGTLRLTLSGPSSEVLADLSQEVERVLDDVPVFADVRSEATRGGKEIRVVVDRERARQYGFSSQQVGQTVASAMRGQPLRRFRTASGEVEMRLQFAESDRQSIDQLRALPLQRPPNARVEPVAGAEPRAGQIPLGALADLRIARGPQSISRENRSTMVGVTVDYGDLTQPEAKERIDAALANLQLPTGYDWGYGQQVRQEEESQNVMMINLLLALALIYLVMASLFESLIHPAAIWTSGDSLSDSTWVPCNAIHPKGTRFPPQNDGSLSVWRIIRRLSCTEALYTKLRPVFSNRSGLGVSRSRTSEDKNARGSLWSPLLKIKQERKAQRIGQRIVLLQRVNVGDVHANDVVAEARAKVKELAVAVVGVLIEVAGAQREQIAVPVLQARANRKLLQEAEFSRFAIRAFLSTRRVPRAKDRLIERIGIGADLFDPALIVANDRAIHANEFLVEVVSKRQRVILIKVEREGISQTDVHGQRLFVFVVNHHAAHVGKVGARRERCLGTGQLEGRCAVEGRDVRRNS